MNRFAIILGILAVAISLICVAPIDWPPLNLVRFAAVPLFYPVIIIAGIFVGLRQYHASALCGLSGLILVLGLWPVLWSPLDRPVSGSTRLRLLFANMNYANPTPQKLLPVLRAEAPDLVVIVESSPQERAMFENVGRTQYPYRFFYGETHLLSKYPFEDLGYEPIGHTSQGFRIKTINGDLELQVVHLSRPWPYATNLKDDKNNSSREVERLLERLRRSSSKSLLVIGDFNASANSSLIAALKYKLKLRPLPTPNGTWPSAVPGPLRVSLDNALFSKKLAVTRRRVAPDVGSDHRPIIVDLYLRPDTKRALKN